ncbi:MAG: hypothetical protein H5T76_02800 [Streptomyces sp.]|nr:hypothetical protein [Streptomyces sp.]
MEHSTRSARRTTWAAVGGATALVLLTATGAHAEGVGDVRITGTVVNGGKNVKVGTKAVVTFPIAMTIKDDSGAKGVSRLSAFNSSNAYGFFDWTGTTCVKKSSTTSVCTGTMKVDPAWIPASDDINSNRIAGTWQAAATVKANDGDWWIYDTIAHFKVKRASAITVNAGPEPVAKGGTLTVVGKLSRASWESLKYYGFAGAVLLQHRPSGASDYRTVKTVTADGSGLLRTKVTVSSAGTWRWYFPGTTTTARAASAGDFVALK